MSSQQKRNILKKRGIRGKIGNVSPCWETQIAPMSTPQTMELKLICGQVASVKGPPGWALIFTLQNSCQSKGDIAWFNYDFSQQIQRKSGDLKTKTAPTSDFGCHTRAVVKPFSA